jgi:ribosomal protein L11 methyltransferase
MYKTTWKGSRAEMETASMFFTEADETMETAVSLRRLDKPVEEGEDGVWSLETYTEEAPDIPELRAKLTAFDSALANIEHVATEDLPDIDWVAHSLEGLGVVRCGRFVLYGVHDADKLPNEDDDIPIRIDANMAFGTGHHPTTAGCLTLLDRFAGFAPKKVLDLGCGSAILAIAAAKIWKRQVLATDIDEDSVAIAAENVDLNDADDYVITLAADGFNHDEIKDAAPFDFVFANILAGPLAELAPGMAEHVTKNGRVMLAGLMTEQEAGVISAYEAAGFRMINRLDQPTWPVLLFVKT